MAACGGPLMATHNTSSAHRSRVVVRFLELLCVAVIGGLVASFLFALVLFVFGVQLQALDVRVYGSASGHQLNQKER